MCRRRAVVDVDGKDSNNDGKCDKDHGKDQVLPNEWDCFWRGGDDLLNDQEEDGKRHQHWGAERDLLTTIWRQIENKNGKKGQANAGNDEKEGVEKRQPADNEEVGNGGIGRTAISPQTTAACGFYYLPFTIVKIVLFVYVEVLQNYVHLLNQKGNLINQCLLQY